jgi:phosphoglucosamine mutase
MRLFGTDGVRGVANTGLTPELAFKLGRAAAQYFGRETKTPKIIIGRDTRLSGTMLESALAAGICSAGGNAHLLGVIPTPAVSYLTEQVGANAGVVISASHNPFEDNGIKFFSKSGHKLPDAVEDEIAAIVAAPY